MTDIEMAIRILALTHDRDDLAPQHLNLLQWAANGELNEKGKAELVRIYEQVENGGYIKPWFHGIVPMTIDTEGYVYYKNKRVEHYSFPWAFSEEAKEELIRLREKCEKEENQNV
ncbi:hypothetical protein LJC56_10130 [Christensenellaceae bacterium OttesenSCG-928-K19]|nr:hypothetical protein [Christensenellaceae bacterium OttesenSCG-928-K19]